ncbi:MAG: hypothetical protein PHI50_01285 [Alphaproteobacteria bacterium]|nr:hypothetical protein [Alphaproteobacteria bacterium]
MRHTNEQGRSMIEMLGVLAIVGVLSVGGLAGYNMAMNRVKTNRVIDELQLALVNIRTNIPSGDYTNVATIAKSVKALDSTNKTDDLNTQLKGLSGAASVVIAKNDDASFFNLTFANIPVELCRRIASLNWGNDAYIGKIAASIAEGAVTGQAADGSSDSISTCDDTAGVTAALVLTMK